MSVEPCQDCRGETVLDLVDGLILQMSALSERPEVHGILTLCTVVLAVSSLYILL